MGKVVDWIGDWIGTLIFIFIAAVAVLIIAYAVVKVINGDSTPIIDQTVWNPISNGVYYHELAGDGYRCMVIGGKASVAVSCDWR